MTRIILEIAILIFIFLSAGLLTSALLPLFFEKYRNMQDKKVEAASRKLDNLFVEVERKKLMLFFLLTPILLTLVGVLIYKMVLIGVIGGVVGLILPNLLIKQWEARRRAIFVNQLLDGLMLLSGCLKAGLSILQAFEVLVEDTSGPITQEFSWVLKEVKMGMPLEESLRRLNRRMPSEELTLITNSILVSAATGGNLTKVFTRIATTVRDNRKLKNNIKTLTLQGRTQGMIMAILPFVFIWWVLSFNRDQFKVMLNSEIGRMLLIGAALLLALGLYLIHKFSTLPDV